MNARFRQAGILLAGVVLGQYLLYGASLSGRKILLPLDLLAQPQVYLPSSAAAPGVPHNIVLSDLVYSSEPYRQFATAEIRAGRIPLWDPYQFAGSPLNWPQFSPFRVLDYALDSPKALAWGQLAQSIVAGMGAYWFCRRVLGVGFWPAAMAAWCYPLTGFFIFWQGYPPDAGRRLAPLAPAGRGYRRSRRACRWGGPAWALVTCLVIL